MPFGMGQKRFQRAYTPASSQMSWLKPSSLSTSAVKRYWISMKGR